MPRFTTVLREVLARYEKTPEITQSDIAHEMQRNRSSVNASCKRLVALGYLEQRGQGDYRVTAEGRSVLRPSAGASRYIRCPGCGRKFTG
jgi:Mn-dependent DtxR family transcriptional regulator